MKRTTPPLDFDLEALLPSVRGTARNTLRLHPRRKSGLELFQSKVGGTFALPRKIQCPRCEEHGRQYIPVLQLNQKEVPSFSFPENTDLFQLWWCPHDHDDCGYCPSLKILWHNVSAFDGIELYPVPIRPADWQAGYFPFECALNPELVAEYPPIDTLSESDRQNLRRWKTDGDYLYQCCYSVAPGLKLGGFPNWCQYPEVPERADGSAVEYFLTLDSGEGDRIGMQRWLPLEERHLIPPETSVVVKYPDGGSMHTSRDLTPEEATVWTPERFEEARTVENPTGLMIGDCGQINVFLDRRTSPWTHRAVMQCS